MEVLTTVADYGGKHFKKSLLMELIKDEDDDFMNEIVYEHLVKNDMNLLHPKTAHSERSSDDEFVSSEESAEDQDSDGWR